MKKGLLLLSAMYAFAFTSNAQIGNLKLDKGKVTEAAGNAAVAITLSDADINALCVEYMTWMDANNPVCKLNSSDPGMKKYAKRLDDLVKKHVNEDGLKLDIKVYYVVEQNAFACANGSIRIFAGLMDIMTDEQILGVIGHEIGHIKNGDTKAAIKAAYLAMAGKGLIASTGSTAAKLSDGQLGQLGEALINAQFSQKQEYAADMYGYNFLKKHGHDQKAMASALRVIEGLQKSSPDKVSALFSTHPASGKRAKKLEALDK